VLDLGSGGGLPGLVLAELWRFARLTLVDANERRTDFLAWAVGDLDLGDRVRVVRARAESLARDPEERSAYDLVVARSFGPPAVTAECSAPFLRAGGALVVSEPPGDPDGSRWPEDGLTVLGMRPEIIDNQPADKHPVDRQRGDDQHADDQPDDQHPRGRVKGTEQRYRFQVLRQVSACPDRYPRRDGVPAKRPVF